MLTIVDEYTRECLAINVGRRLRSIDLVEQLSDLFLGRGVPNYIRSDNGPEFTAQIVREWLQRIGVKTLFIEPGSPWENGYVESFNGKFRDECLNREIFYTLTEAKVLIDAGGRSTTYFVRTAHWATGHPRRQRSPHCRWVPLRSTHRQWLSD